MFILVLSLLRSLYLNFKFLPFKQAIKIPLLFRYDTVIKGNGKYIVDSEVIKPALVRIGFHKIPVKHNSCAVLINYGKIIFKGSQHIGMGTIIHVNTDARLELGDNFAISGHSSINCYKSIKIGKDVQFAWDCLVMDSDTHTIYDVNYHICNCDKQITIGDHVWVGCRATILKGTVVPNNCVIGACSLVTGNKFSPNTIIVGTPAHSIKQISGFAI